MAAKVVYALHIYMWYSKGTEHCACRMHPGIYTGGRITGLGQDIKDAAANLSAALGKGESCAVHTCLYALCHTFHGRNTVVKMTLSIQMHMHDINRLLQCKYAHTAFIQNFEVSELITDRTNTNSFMGHKETSHTETKDLPHQKQH